jgi:hypothetical protein
MRCHNYFIPVAALIGILTTLVLLVVHRFSQASYTVPMLYFGKSKELLGQRLESEITKRTELTAMDT